MLCAISGEAPQEPVVSKKSGAVYEKRLIEKYIDEHGTEPGTDEELSIDDLVIVKSAHVVRPRPPTLTSIPALLATFQNEWDDLALQVFGLEQQVAKLQKELSNALYQNDAAIRVIARLTKERDEARASLSKVTVTGSDGANGEAMAIDSTEALPEELAEKVDATHKELSKGRKKRPIPKAWATAEEVEAFESQTSTDTSISQTTSLAVGDQGEYAIVAGLQGEAAVYAVAATKVERTLSVKEPVTDAIWSGPRVMFGTSKGTVKVFDSGSEVASLSEHAGAVTALSLHPSDDILASVGSDKGIVFYDLGSFKRVSRSYTESALTSCAFHPDGHLFAAGSVAGDIKLFMTNTLELAAQFGLGAPIQALAFSENGFWLAATAKGQSTVTIFDLRKEGDAATAKVLEVGGAAQSLSWDYTGQFLATAGASGVTVQHYTKSSKSWSEPFRNSVPAISAQWGPEARQLVLVDGSGVVKVFGTRD